MKRKVLKICVLCALIIVFGTIIVFAASADKVDLVPTDDQYFELRAVEVKEVAGQNKQVIMELWGNNLEAKGFDVRFTYDKTKIQPSDLQTNQVISNDAVYLEFEDEFKNCLDFFTVPFDIDGEGIRSSLFFNPPIVESEHIVEKTGYGKVLDTKGSVLIGKMSFQMTEDVFDANWFHLVESADTYPMTGIKINIDGVHNFQKSSSFRFTDKIASNDADLKNLILSKGQDDTYKEYELSPKFDKDTLIYESTLLEYGDEINLKAVLADEKATMKIKVPKRDENDKLVYENDGVTIVYEEKALSNDTQFGVVLNKLGEPDTIIDVIVTAEDGVTVKDYKVTVKRPYGTIKGSAQLGENLRESMQLSYGVYTKYLINANVYEAGVFNWNGLVDEVSTYAELDLIKKERTVITDEDSGAYEILVIPGKYDLQLERLGFLNVVVKNITVNAGDVIDLGNKVLCPGDVDRNGVISLQDYTKLMNVSGVDETDPLYGIQYDFGQKGYVALIDITTVLNYMDSLIVVEEY